MRTLHRDVGDEVAEVVLIRARHGRRRRDRELVAEALLLRQFARLEARGVMGHDDRLAVVVLGRVGYVVLHGCAYFTDHEPSAITMRTKITMFTMKTNNAGFLRVHRAIVAIVIESWHAADSTHPQLGVAEVEIGDRVGHVLQVVFERFEQPIERARSRSSDHA